eukprot:CAMPEP_0170561376 /NCGR_PEP_ID=MMETSP0211-20121228/54447_1 /TAXON_ID=311385 /ORGANISM="Pseudokeronopsis sp., Strain OXSARD2" /LENGTH=69 /DNA_ID=CAMNT_0010876841 /DNA_START=126 /DNA_END=332 /DNA_ORIENTATION=-
MGKFPFSNTYSTSKGDILLEKMYIASDVAVHPMCPYPFFAHAIDFITYSLGYCDLELQQKVSNEVFDQF